MSNSAIDPEKYQSPARATVRFAAQEILLKPLVWRLSRVEVHGAEHLDGLQSPYIVTANHSSHLDTALIYGALPPRLSRYLAVGAAADYFFDKKYKSLIPQLFFNAYPVERKGYRSRKGLSKKLLAEGVPLLIFAEGTRSRTGAMGHFKPGVAALCISFDVPCVPIALVGAYAAWPSMQKHLPRGRPEIHVVIGHPLSPGPGELAHAFSERIRRNVAELHDSTARAYGLPTLDDYARAVALAEAASASSPGSPSGPEPAIDQLPTQSEPPPPPHPVPARPSWMTRAVSAAKAASDALIDTGASLSTRKGDEAPGGDAGHAERTGEGSQPDVPDAVHQDSAGDQAGAQDSRHPAVAHDAGHREGTGDAAHASRTDDGSPASPDAATKRGAGRRTTGSGVGSRRHATTPDGSGRHATVSGRHATPASGAANPASDTAGEEAPAPADPSTSGDSSAVDASTHPDQDLARTHGRAAPELDQRVRSWFSRLGHKDTSDTTKEPQ